MSDDEDELLNADAQLDLNNIAAVEVIAEEQPFEPSDWNSSSVDRTEDDDEEQLVLLEESPSGSNLRLAKTNATSHRTDRPIYVTSTSSFSAPQPMEPSSSASSPPQVTYVVRDSVAVPSSSKQPSSSSAEQPPPSNVVGTNAKWQVSKVTGTDASGKNFSLTLWKAAGSVWLSQSDASGLTGSSDQSPPPLASMSSPPQQASLYTGDLDLDSMCVVGGSNLTSAINNANATGGGGGGGYIRLLSPDQTKDAETLFASDRLSDGEEDMDGADEDLHRNSVYAASSSARDAALDGPSSSRLSPTLMANDDLLHTRTSSHVLPSPRLQLKPKLDRGRHRRLLQPRRSTDGDGEPTTASSSPKPVKTYSQKTTLQKTTRSGFNIDLSDSQQLVAFSRINEKTKVTEKNVPCPKKGCNKMFSGVSALRKHLPWHGAKSFTCAQCGRGFVERAKLIRHQKVHTGERPFVCSFPNCGKRFAHDFNLKTHVRVHTGDKPFACPFDCPLAFAQSCNLKAHMKTHMKERKASNGDGVESLLNTDEQAVISQFEQSL